MTNHPKGGIGFVGITKAVFMPVKLWTWKNLATVSRPPLRPVNKVVDGGALLTAPATVDNRRCYGVHPKRPHTKTVTTKTATNENGRRLKPPQSDTKTAMYI